MALQTRKNFGVVCVACACIYVYTDVNNVIIEYREMNAISAELITDLTGAVFMFFE